MSVLDLFRPRPTLSDGDTRAGLRYMLFEGVASMGFASIITSGFLAAYALALGATNFQIGIMAALPFLTQPLQIPVILLIEKMRWRKAIAIGSWLPAQSVWIPIALIPLVMDVPASGAVWIMLGLFALRSVGLAVTNCSWNSWIRDLVPQSIMGSFFANRLLYATFMAMGFGMAAAVFVDVWALRVPAEDATIGYTIALLVGALTLGFASPAFMALMPEPSMQETTGERLSLRETLSAPFRDPNFRHLLRFHLLWGFALNMATAFFAVYMLQKIGLSVTAVMGFAVLSQATNALFLRTWGALADRMGSKVILQLSASVYLLVIIGWTFTTMPDRHFLTIPMLAVLHVLAGIATAGVTITSGTIGMKLAPRGQATSYLAVAALFASLGAGIAPIVGGLVADFFSVRQLSVTIEWTAPGGQVALPAVDITGLDFLFLIAFLIGIPTVNTLTSLREEGEVTREVALDALLAPMQRMTAPMTSVPGLTALNQFPYGYIRRTSIPGLGVALGVTAYQIAETARVAVEAAAHGRRVTERVADSVEEVAGRMIEAGRAAEQQGAEVARQVTRGAVTAVHVVSDDAGRLVHEAVEGAMAALERTPVDTGDALFGASYGALQGALESGMDPSAAAGEVLNTAREIAEQRPDLTEEEAVRQAAQAILEAAGGLTPEASEGIRQVIQEAGVSLEEPAPGDGPEPGEQRS